MSITRIWFDEVPSDIEHAIQQANLYGIGFARTRYVTREELAHIGGSVPDARIHTPEIWYGGPRPKLDDVLTVDVVNAAIQSLEKLRPSANPEPMELAPSSMHPELQGHVNMVRSMGFTDEMPLFVPQGIHDYLAKLGDFGKLFRVPRRIFIPPPGYAALRTRPFGVTMARIRPDERTVPWVAS